MNRYRGHGMAVGFWCGWIVAIATICWFQGHLGLEGYIAWLSTHWIHVPVLVWPIVIINTLMAYVYVATMD